MICFYRPTTKISFISSDQSQAAFFKNYGAMDDFATTKLKKSNHFYTRGIALKRATRGGAPLRGLAPGQHSIEESTQRWRAAGDTDLTDPVIKPQMCRTVCDVFNRVPTLF